MDDKETSCQGSNFGDFKSVDEVVRFYKLPNQKTKTSKDNFQPRVIKIVYNNKVKIWILTRNYQNIRAMLINKTEREVCN